MFFFENQEGVSLSQAGVPEEIEFRFQKGSQWASTATNFTRMMMDVLYDGVKIDSIGSGEFHGGNFNTDVGVSGEKELVLKVTTAGFNTSSSFSSTQCYLEVITYNGQSKFRGMASVGTTINCGVVDPPLFFNIYTDGRQV